MATNAFSSLANIRLHLPARLVANSCCPDKDLVVLFSRLGGTDRMSLWSSNQGSRIWEVDVGDGNCHAAGISWSPDGQSIAVMQDPPAISLHSLQDGQVTLTLPVNLSPGERSTSHLDGMWWFREEPKTQNSSSIPDIFKRRDIITGSSHSVFKLLPLLDNLQEDTEKLTATDLFAFQGSATRKAHKTNLPEVINSWPTLAADLSLASISATSRSKMSSETANIDEADKSNLNSILLVTDSSGHLFSYLDGTFPLGAISVGENLGFPSILKHPQRPLFVGSQRSIHDKIPRTSLNPILVELPLLAQRKSRDLARLSSTSRELVWYTLRIAKEMRDVWYGSESNTGAREFGPKWIQALEAKQKEDFGEEVNPILDLTCLLTTGRPSESLSDFLGSGEQMSERGIQKWESTVSEGLIKLRDSAEKRIAPALQRLHLVLDEVLGWSKLREFASFELSAEEITKCLQLASNGILIANWLAATCRTEISRFREFMSWLRHEVNTVNNTADASAPRHDVLEVNNYLIDGLASSTIDNWFIGPVPEFQSHDLGILEYKHSTLNEALDRAFEYAGDPSKMTWQAAYPRTDIGRLDRNLEALMQDLARRCERVFHHAAGATSRTAVVSFETGPHAEAKSEKKISPDEPTVFPFRERAVLNENGELLQHLVAKLPSNDNNNTMILVQFRCDIEAAEARSEIGIALLECYLPEEEEEEDRSNIELLDADFFDDECVVIVYRVDTREKQAFIATVNYSDIGYQKLVSEDYVKTRTREDLMEDVLELWKKGHIRTRSGINRRRALSGCRSGGVSLGLNGRAGRRVGCVLDCFGTELETFDLEGDGEDMEVA